MKTKRFRDCFVMQHQFMAYMFRALILNITDTDIYNGVGNIMIENQFRYEYIGTYAPRKFNLFANSTLNYNKSSEFCPKLTSTICNLHLLPNVCMCYISLVDRKQILRWHDANGYHKMTDIINCDKIKRFYQPVFEIQFRFPLPNALALHAELMLFELMETFLGIKRESIVILRQGCEFSYQFYFFQFVVLKNGFKKGTITRKDILPLPLNYFLNNALLMKQTDMPIESIKKTWFLYPIYSYKYPKFMRVLGYAKAEETETGLNCTEIDDPFNPYCWKPVELMKLAFLFSIMLLMVGIYAYDAKQSRIERAEISKLQNNPDSTDETKL